MDLTLIAIGLGLLAVVYGIIEAPLRGWDHPLVISALVMGVGLLAVVGSGRGLTKIMPLLSGDPVERPSAVVSQSIMAVLAIIFVALCIKSFRDARRGRVAV